ncbi:MAG: acylphosphatase [Candidatus Kapaibacterium sp.]|nr:MAG: acylphosphatase [Candidatus Kapabacteria bacterium]
MSAPELAAARLAICGRVQGVGYRMFALRVATELGLVGTVRNAPDGRTVIVTVEGPRRAIEQLHDRCWQGPPHAAVEAVTIEWITPSGRYHDFRIER